MNPVKRHTAYRSADGHGVGERYPMLWDQVNMEENRIYIEAGGRRVAVTVLFR